jgi:hypothetical protein
VLQTIDRQSVSVYLGDVLQDLCGDREVEGLGVHRQGGRGALDEVHRLGARARPGQGVHALAGVDAHHHALGADALGEVQREQAGAGADVEHAEAPAEVEEGAEVAALPDDVGLEVGLLDVPRAPLAEVEGAGHGATGSACAALTWTAVTRLLRRPMPAISITTSSPLRAV